ncbi:MAG: hypothetical protein COC19_02680 [SAR86 cluster bacterium]|uniref:Penicillin-binding protein activator n=1 Tax=SAR86 cluster bacterium TaxID=2030880 RepID=A0A2A4MS09_9GAMM|nr:MAG: hypothetical protein COC19_02680 [SAR86 cluster bacterium]
MTATIHTISLANAGHWLNQRKVLATLCLCLFILGCSSSPTNTSSGSVGNRDLNPIESLLTQASISPSPAAERLLLTALELMLAEDAMELADATASSLDNSALNPPQQIRLVLIKAQIARRQRQPQMAIELLINSLSVHPQNQQLSLSLAISYRDNLQYVQAANLFISLSQNSSGQDSLNFSDEIWQCLNAIDPSELLVMASSAETYSVRGWVELIRTVSIEQSNIKNQLDAIAQWQRVWPRHSAAQNLPTALLDLQEIWDVRPRHIALLLPLSSQAGKAIEEGFTSAYYLALSQSQEVPRISLYDTSEQTSIFPLYDRAVADNADLIIGPLSKELVSQLTQFPQLPIPTLALNYADETNSNVDNLFQFGLAPENEMYQAADMAWRDGHRNAAIVTPRSENYQRLQDLFAQYWQQKGGQLVSQSSFDNGSDYAAIIRRLLSIDSSEERAAQLKSILPRNSIVFTPRHRSDIDFIFLIANPRQGRQINPTLDFFFAGDIPIYSMPSINDGQENQDGNRDLDGIIFTDAPWLLSHSSKITPLKAMISSNLRPAQSPLQRLRAMGADSFSLYPLLQQIANGEMHSLQGTTGILTMDSSQRIQRQLESAVFIDGIATPIPPQ